mmetsp:Transcript_89302/g.178467  ORF Transcript_89302/g.178467 Transcript_89302/m.178467 type:complete len:216 (-) Transcript_89302:118-765(-)
MRSSPQQLPTYPTMFGWRKVADSRISSRNALTLLTVILSINFTATGCLNTVPLNTSPKAPDPTRFFNFTCCESIRLCFSTLILLVSMSAPSLSFSPPCSTSSTSAKADPCVKSASIPDAPDRITCRTMRSSCELSARLYCCMLRSWKCFSTIARKMSPTTIKLMETRLQPNTNGLCPWSRPTSMASAAPKVNRFAYCATLAKILVDGLKNGDTSP